MIIQSMDRIINAMCLFMCLQHLILKEALGLFLSMITDIYP